MQIHDAIKELGSGGGIKLYIPSYKESLIFKRVNTRIQKALGKIALDGEDKYHTGVIRLALFGELLLEGTKEHRPSELKIIDVVAFIAQLRMQSSPVLKARVTCPSCGAFTDLDIDLKKVIENCGKHNFREFTVEIEGGTPPHRYEFTLCEPSYMDTLILMESARKSHFSGVSTISETELYYVYNKLCLYIDSVKMDGEEIKGEDDTRFCKIPIADRMKFFDNIHQHITIDTDNRSSLLNFIAEHFNDDADALDVFNGALSANICSNGKCAQGIGEVMSFDAFFAV